ncbi:MAG: hypothetical protein M3Y78_08030 [Pseudomonadota bacterium]|nr:hypothetical protein [Pseudomonadota bacterium]
MPELVVTSGGLNFGLGAVLFAGGGGKLTATSAGRGSGFWRIQDGTNGLAAVRSRLGNAIGLSATMVPSDVREHAQSGIIMLPAKTATPILRIANTRKSGTFPCRVTKIVEILGRKTPSLPIWTFGGPVRFLGRGHLPFGRAIGL